MTRDARRVAGGVDGANGMAARAGGLVGRFSRRWRGRRRGSADVMPVAAAGLEPLERRCLMSAGVVMGTTGPIISEFLAVNDSGLRDEDGDRPDWIELYNPTGNDINLDGYFLTNDSADLDRWRLPAVTLGSGDFLTVFASEKNRQVPGGELHTSFKLSSDAGYLGLVAPDGTTVLSEYDPYPAQVSNVSYGISVNETTTPLVGPQATVRAFVPADNSLGTTWTRHDFDDAAWLSGVTGVGYERENPVVPPAGFRTRMVDVAPGTDVDISHIGEALAILDSADGTAGGAFTVQSDTTPAALPPVINMGPGGAYGGDRALPNGMTSTEMYAIRAMARVFIPAGRWTINVNSDDGFRLNLPGVTFIDKFNEDPNGAGSIGAGTLVYGGLRGANNTYGTFTVGEDGLTTTLQLDFFENSGGDSLELAIAPEHRLTFSNTTFQLLGNGVQGWTVTDPTVNVPINYQSLIGLDIEPQAYNRNATAYVRVPFSVDNAADFGSLRLRLKYEDGFVAYLNGTEFKRSDNAPATLTYNSQATSNRDENAAIRYETITVPPGLLRTGSNVLAIHTLNVSSTSSDMLIYPELQGSVIQLNDEARYLATPTPGAHNSPTAGDGVVLDTRFSVDRGFFDAPFQLAITTETQGATIRYTTDGSAPTATTGTVYSGPITVSRTTTLRAAAFKPNYLSSNVDTQTYLFLGDVIRQSPTAAPGPGWPAPNTRVNNQIINYGMDPDIVNSATYGPQIVNALKSLPTFSIVTEVGNLFNPSTGIYVNPGGDGRPWERPASVELIHPDGSRGFQIDAGLRLRGGYSRSTDNPKHAWRLFFRNEYDGDLEYPMFGPNGAQQFDGFDLRTTQNYSWAFGGDAGSIFMRDQFSRDAQLAMGQPAERGDWYHLYINGQYWGLYNTDERPEANYGASYFGGRPEDYDTIKVDPDLGYNIEATDGNMDAWNVLYQMLRANGPGTVTEAVYQQVQGNNSDGTPNLTMPVLLDVDNLIDYMLVIYYGGNLDAAISNFLGNNSPNNFFAVRNRNLDARMGFKFFAHDAEHTLLNVNENRLGPASQPGVGWAAGSQGVGKSNPQWFFQQLWHLDSFKRRVADHVQKHMVSPGGALTPAKARERLLARKNEIDLATVAESARWGDSKREPPITRADFNNAFNNVYNNYLPNRTNVVINQLRQWNIIPAFHGPAFSPAGGQVSAGSTVTITTGTGTPAGSTIYYTTDGTDPYNRVGQPGVFQYTGPITINDTTTIRARTRTGGAAWSAISEATFSLDVASLRVTELMYHPAAPAPGSAFTADDDFEFIEVQNTGPAALDLEGVRILGDDVSFTFPTDFTLAAGGRALVVKNRAAFEERYGAAGFNIAGTFQGTLSNSGQEVRLVSASGQNVFTFTYSDSWYPQTDGEGYSLAVINPAAVAAAWSQKGNWRPSERLGGSPGAGDTGPLPGTVLVNEVLANPDAAGADFIELRNTGGVEVNLGGWFISDAATNLTRFRIPDGTVLPAGGYVVLNQAALGFDLAAGGGEVWLSSGDPASGELFGYRESARYTAADPGVSFGQFAKTTGGTDFVQLLAPTPGAANGRALVGPVVINEIMYHPASNAAGEYVELHNLTASDILLNDPSNPTGPWKFGDGIDFVFPTGATIPAFGYVLVVSNDPGLFRLQYDVPPAVTVFGPYQRADGSNNLANEGENLTLLRPTAAGYALADRVNFTIAAPWPTLASGNGHSIIRHPSTHYGNDANGWLDETGGSPGRTNLDLEGPGADVLDVTPDPRSTPVDSVQILFEEPVRGLDLADLRLTRDGGANLLTGAQTLSTTDNVTWTLSGLSGVTGAVGSYTLTVVAGVDGAADWAGNAMAGDASDTWRVGAPPSGRVVGRHTFYNNSVFDGTGAAADVGAIATDKQALLPGQTATFANYTSYHYGINGVMIDMQGLEGTPLKDQDFLFHVGNDADPSSWTPAPAPVSLERRVGAGAGGSDRLVLIWADGAVRNQWLRVTVRATGRTALPADDVFYFGNLCGETGDKTSAADVTEADVAAVRMNFTSGSRTVPINSRYDFDRNGRVNSNDLVVVRRGLAAGSLTLITAPGGAAAAASLTSAQAAPSTSSTDGVFSQTAIAPTTASSGSTAGTGTSATLSVLARRRADLLGRV